MTSTQEPSTRTFGNEDGLPRVPLPTLEDTCARFLAWCAPLLSEDELTATRAAVAEYLAPDSPSRTLHAALEKFDATEGVHSWLDIFWPYRYLGRRERIALNANFFFLFQNTGQSQVERAAGLISGALDFKQQVDSEQLAPELLRGQPLSMEQNKYLFSATRIPGTERDGARTPYSDEHPGPSPEHHILVFRRGRMFRLDVIGPDGDPHTLDELAAGLQSVLDAAPAAPGTSVGHLTTKARAEWAASRHALRELDPHNVQLLDTVESALFCLCLEDLDAADPLAQSDQLLHGDSANRWFDKAVSLIVFPDGSAGVNGEHCKLDGTTIVGFIDAMMNTSDEEHSCRSGARAQGPPTVTPLDFVLDETLRADVTAAGAGFAAYAADTATTTLSIDFTAERAKTLRCSPDAFAQLAFQLAHQRAKGHIGATYESIATRRFQHGRTEAMRVVTPEIAAFVAAMDDPAAGQQDRRDAFRAAAARHVERAKQCQVGQAPEQHLWELQLIARRRGAELGVTEPLALYGSPGWLIMRDDYLSTSAVPSPNVQFFGFGSTSDKCIGLGYAFMPTRFDLYLSTPQAVSDQMFSFADRLVDAVAELHELLTGETGE